MPLWDCELVKSLLQMLFLAIQNDALVSKFPVYNALQDFFQRKSFIAYCQKPCMS